MSLRIQIVIADFLIEFELNAKLLFSVPSAGIAEIAKR